MKCFKNIILYSIFIITAQTGSYSYTLWDPAGTAVVKEINKTLKDNLPAVTVALTGVGTELGRNIGVGALETIGAGITKTAAAAKAAVEAVIASPAIPYIVAAGVVCGAGYVGYKYYGPIAQKEAALKKCLEQNQTGERASSGVPCVCQGEACSLSLAVGHEKVDKIVDNFTKYAPEAQSKTMWERASSTCNSIVNSSAAGAAHAVITAPFDYTIGALANRSGLASTVTNLEFIKSDSCYSATIGNGATNVAKYAFAAAVVYCAAKGVHAAYKYVTKPDNK